MPERMATPTENSRNTEKADATVELGIVTNTYPSQLDLVILQ